MTQDGYQTLGWLNKIFSSRRSFMEILQSFSLWAALCNLLFSVVTYLALPQKWKKEKIIFGSVHSLYFFLLISHFVERFLLRFFAPIWMSSKVAKLYYSARSEFLYLFWLRHTPVRETNITTPLRRFRFVSSTTFWTCETHNLLTFNTNNESRDNFYIHF